MRTFYVSRETEIFLRMKTARGVLIETVRKAGIAAGFFFAAALLPCLLLLPAAIFDSRIRPLVLIGAVFGIGIVVNAFFFPRYAAPGLAVVYAVMLQCLRHLRATRVDGQRFGRALVRYLAVVCILVAVVRIWHDPLQVRMDRFPTLWYGPGPIGLPRAGVAAQMNSRPGKHLIIVRYSPDHDCFDEWVYNAADIDGSKIVWAREMSAERNKRLIDYFADRRVWLVEPDKMQPSITPYRETGISSRPELQKQSSNFQTGSSASGRGESDRTRAR
jgi:hypothetical protein